MLEIEFLSALGKKTDLKNCNAAEVLRFCKGIDWVQEIKNHNNAYRSDENINYEDYWYLDLANVKHQLTLNVFTNYTNADTVTKQSISFVVVLSQYEMVETGWFEKLLTRKAEKKDWNSAHAPEVTHEELEKIIEWFVAADLTNLHSTLNIPGDYDFGD